MLYTKDVILQADNIYELLIHTPDTLLDHETILDDLSYEEKINLASFLVSEANIDEKKWILFACESMNNKKVNSFKSICYRALNVVETIDLLLNPKCTLKNWLKSYDAQLLDEFRVLTNYLIDGEKRNTKIYAILQDYDDHFEPFSIAFKGSLLLSQLQKLWVGSRYVSRESIPVLNPFRINKKLIPLGQNLQPMDMQPLEWEEVAENANCCGCFMS